MTYYKVYGITILDNKEIEETFTRERDAIDFIKRLGVKQGLRAQIDKIEKGCKQCAYSYNPDKAKAIKLLEDNNIPYELDDNLSIRITL